MTKSCEIKFDYLHANTRKAVEEKGQEMLDFLASRPVSIVSEDEYKMVKSLICKMSLKNTKFSEMIEKEKDLSSPIEESLEFSFEDPSQIETALQFLRSLK